jgi:uncharacterized protein (TIGR02145 family)
MKNSLSFTGLILSLLLFILIHSCKKDKPTPPSVATIPVTEISYTTAISGGNVTNEGGSPVISRGICWNTSVDPTISNNKTSEGLGTGAFISNIAQLSFNTKYYVRAYATNSVGTGYGNPVVFTTLQVEVPVLTTSDISSITQTTAASGGNITDDKGASITARGICWGITENPTISDAKTSDNSGIGTFTSSLTGLTGNTAYYVRAYATNSAGTQYGNQVNFKTSPLMPTIATEIVSSITSTSSKSGGTVSSDGGAPVTSRGVCWSTSGEPKVTDGKTDNGTGSGTFTSFISGLDGMTTYYIRAYATNIAGTAYGNERSFKTYAVNDIDGNGYNSVTIGTQIWMATNLMTSKYIDGEEIPLITDNTGWSNLTTPGFCWYNNDAATYKPAYGALYNWYAANSSKLCPTGWHVPTDTEWKNLTDYLGGNSVAAGKMKEEGITHWTNPNTGATNESNFTALPGGYRDRSGIFYYTGNYGRWWSSSEYDSQSGWGRGMGYNEINISFYGYIKQIGFSVRCLKD